MITPNYRSFAKVVEFFQTRCISTNVYPVFDGYCLEFTYQCNDGKRIVCFRSFNENTLYCYSSILEGNTSHYEFLSKESKIRLYLKLRSLPLSCQILEPRRIILGLGIKK